VLKFLQLGGILGAVLYGWGWLEAVRFYDHFGLSPEEVGITTSWLLTRAAFAAIPTASIVFILVGVVRLRGHTPRILYYGAWTLAAIAALGFALRVVARGQDSTATIFWIGSAIGFVVMVIGFIAWRTRRRATTLGILMVAAIGFVIFTTQYIWRIADDSAATVAQRGFTSIDLNFGIPIFRVEAVNVFQVSGDKAPNPLFDGCASLLGSADGTTIVVASTSEREETVWRLPTDQIALEDCYSSQ
jgi:hypothetical protein